VQSLSFARVVPFLHLRVSFVVSWFLCRRCTESEGHESFSSTGANTHGAHSVSAISIFSSFSIESNFGGVPRHQRGTENQVDFGFKKEVRRSPFF